MLMPRWLLAVLVSGVAALQAWDSHATQAEGAVQILIAIAIVLPGAAVLASGDSRLRGVAVVCAGVLLTIARFVSAVRLPELTLAALFPAMLLLLDHVAGQRRRASVGHE